MKLFKNKKFITTIGLIAMLALIVGIGAAVIANNLPTAEPALTTTDGMTSTLTLSLKNLPDGKKVDYASFVVSCDTPGFEITQFIGEDPDNVYCDYKYGEGYVVFASNKNGKFYFTLEKSETTFAGLGEGDAVLQIKVVNTTDKVLKNVKITVESILCYTDGNSDESVISTNVAVKYDKHTHALTHKEEKIASCVEEGHKEYWLCELEGCDCNGQIYADAEGKTETTLDALKTIGEHVFTSECDTTCNTTGCTHIRATSTEHTWGEGCVDGECDVCGDTRQPGKHTWTNCEDIDCNTCGASRPAGSHDWDNCEDTECNGCGTTREALEHKGGTATCIAQAVCSECGMKYGELADHVFTSDCDTTCDTADCDHTRQNAADHTFGGGCPDTECDSCGATREALTHTGGHADCKNKAVCETCGASYGELGDHSYSDGKCTVCGIDNPQTGDEAALLPVMILMVLAAASIVIVVSRKKNIV